MSGIFNNGKRAKKVRISEKSVSLENICKSRDAQNTHDNKCINSSNKMQITCPFQKRSEMDIALGNDAHTQKTKIT